jgi:hypothetical protein
MFRYASITGNMVGNIIVANTKEDAELATGCECIQFDDTVFVQPGDLYDSSTGQFSRNNLENNIDE